MLYVRVFAATDQAPEVVRVLGDIPNVRHVMRSPTADGRDEMVTAELPAAAVDAALDALLAIPVPANDVTVERTSQIDPVEGRRGRWLTHREDALVWAEVVEGARENARLPARYLVYMFVAGVLAGFALLLQNSVLMVGAMAVSPDLLPVTAACVGIVGHRPRLIGRSLGTLALGMTVAMLTACLLTVILDRSGYLIAKLPIGSQLILTPHEDLLLPTIVIAFVAGIAGMIATESRASAAVGVAISVTTIPSAAYAGVALAVGTTNETLFGLGFLGINIASLLIGGSLALLVQRSLNRRSREKSKAA